DAEFRHD
nr:Chain P, Amyloid beta A4 protein [Homo sapiens]3IFO_P Chain P, Amyloid beta A4 protein [Homo sapiens]3IFO_Q Chain Q, Amyloid beta A4 protein [Homo sapiens]3IFP_P Chain P, Amyloid beta A4 protein [Homo sapiens]3IFP_Q Chain Q, Amyloid beta A4 protein [Homo sapiens]3IFP_R Chain R, Amyloid beta A4 protein [Homo sapiens]3IFP_S Chain S, Amyloid beta A4 protein [Homo sapiens]4ONF_P Chain P, Amyloid beta A4 protein [Homo sapiens]